MKWGNQTDRYIDLDNLFSKENGWGEDIKNRIAKAHGVVYNSKHLRKIKKMILRTKTRILEATVMT